jgi:hypothetical protein
MSFKIDTNTVLPIVLPDATETSAGLMSAADKAKLDSLSPGGGSAFIVVNNFPGADLGAKINAADAFLGASAGDLLVIPGDYVFITPVVLSPNRLLRLSAGHYFNLTPAGFATILLNDNCVVEGDGWQTVIDEPDAPSFVIFNTVADFNTGTDANTNIQLRDFQLLGKGSVVGLTAQSTIALGNAANVIIERVFFNGTAAIGVAIGGSSATGKFADTITVSDCVFESIPSENLGIVNGQNIIISKNYWRNPLGSGSPLDMEPNTASDRLVNITVFGNDFTVGGFLVQGGGGALLDGINIVGNKLNRAVLQGGRNTTVSDNTFSGDQTNALTITTCSYCTFAGNRFKNAGQGPTGGASIALDDTTFCKVKNNVFDFPHKAVGFPGWAAVVEILGSGCDFNEYFNNTLQQPIDAPDAMNFPIISVEGPNSRVVQNNYAGRWREGGVEKMRTPVALDYSILQSDQIVDVDTTLAVVAVTLPDPAVIAATNTFGPVPGPGGFAGPTSGSQIFVVGDEGGAAGTNAITIKRFGAEKINGVAADITITVPYGRVTLYSNGTDWFATGSVNPVFTPVVFAGAWADFGAGFAPCGYWKDGLGVVHLRGLATGGLQGQTIFTLPVGFRPAFTVYCSVVSSNLFGVIQIGSDGVVSPPVAAGTYWSLDSITFTTV